MNKKLLTIWTDPSSPAAFVGPQKLYQYAKSINVDDVTLAKVKLFLSQQPVYYEYRQQHRKFKRTPILTQCPLQEIQSDLGNMDYLKRWYKKSIPKYLLVLIDAYSRYAWTYTLKTKHASQVAEALENFFAMGFSIGSFFVDNGTEYKSDVTKLLESKNVTVYRSRNPTIKAALAENFLRNFKNRLFKQCAANQKMHYDQVIVALTDGYNKAKQKGLNSCSPFDILHNVNDQASLFAKKYIQSWKPKITRSSLKVGDFVVTALQRYKSFEKGFSQNYSHVIYKIAKINNRTPVPTFKLQDTTNGDILPTKWYAEELQKVSTPLKPVQHIHL